jgi:carboxyl-terminal processing protease
LERVKSRVLFIGGLLFFLAGFGFWLGTSSTDLSARRANRPAAPAARTETDREVYEHLELFGKAFEITRARYIDEVSAKELIEAAIDGMLSKRDPHSGFLNAEDFRQMNETTRGGFGGLGIEVTMDRGVVRVISPMDDTPAFKAGMEAGDLITHIDGAQVYGLSLREAINKMKGKPGTKVKLKVFREGREPFDVEITRAIIKIDAVRSRRLGDVGILRLSAFNENASRELTRAVNEMMRDKSLKGFVLDLRNNTGGLLDQAVAVSNLFLDQGEVVSIKSRSNEAGGRVYFANKDDLTKGMPIVVLINGGSASAAEIVAGALQDHRRAVIMGTKSYGKGSVQTLIPLGNATALKLTTARYYTPSGKSIQADGIEPDIVVNRARIEEIKEDRSFSESTILNALKQSETPAAATRPRTEREQREEERDRNDYQLQRAADMVRGLFLMREQSALPKTEAEKKTDKK